MKTAAIAFAALTLAAGAASAQTGMTAAKPGAKPAAPASHVASSMTTPTKTAPATTTTSKTTVKGGPVTHTAASIECSKQADAQGLHGKAREKMRSACKAAAAKK